MNGIHAEVKRAADALDAINTREIRREAKARAAAQARIESEVID